MLLSLRRNETRPCVFAFSAPNFGGGSSSKPGHAASADDVAEEDGVRDLHHGGLQVGGEEHALFLGALDLL